VLRVAADLTSFLTPRTGVGVFATEIVRQLAGRDDVETTGFAITWRGRGALAELVPPGVGVADRPMPARPLRVLWKRLDHPRVDHWIGRHDVVWGPNFVVPPSRAAQVVTVHDLTPMRFPQLANRATLAYPALIRRALRRGAWIHTPSSFVRDEVLAEFRAEPERVVAIHHGVRPDRPEADPRPAVATERERISGRRLAGGDRYILTIGTVEPRKDLPTLVRAFDALAGDDPALRLVIAGPDGWGTEALATALGRARHRDRVVRVGWVSNAERWALLRAASAFCFPSVYEGFGLPPLEAMTAGVPVVATRAGAVPEVCRDGAELVPVGDPDGLAQALGRVLTDDAHRDRLIVRGHVVAASYRWSTTTDAIVDLFRKAAGLLA
jgi:glycosyltransferase involved in cell wall biosynthesis